MLAPISLDCYQKWQKTLPGILDEYPDMVSVNVAFGQSSAFLRYESAWRELTLQVDERYKPEEGDYSFVV